MKNTQATVCSGFLCTGHYSYIDVAPIVPNAHSDSETSGDTAIASASRANYGARAACESPDQYTSSGPVAYCNADGATHYINTDGTTDHIVWGQHGDN